MTSLCRGAAGAWAVLSVLFLVQPAALSPGISYPMDLGVPEILAFWSARPDASPVHVALHVVALVTALVTLGVVTDIHRRLGAPVRWASALAALGLATTAISNVRYLALERTYARLLSEAGPDALAGVAVASASLPLDPYGILEFGTLAVWLLAVTRAVGWRRSGPLSGAAVVGAGGLAGMVAGAVAWPLALELAPILGAPGLVVWLLLVPGVMGRLRSQTRQGAVF